MMDFGVRLSEEQMVFRERKKFGWPKERKRKNNDITYESGLPNFITG